MKSLISISIVAGLLLALTAVPAMAAKPDACTTIQDGTLTYSAGHYLADDPLQVGYDIFGYNYQAYMFIGSYANVYLGRYGFPPYEGDDETYLSENPDAENTWCWPYRNTQVMMQWNDAWLSNKDCDGDYLLDRHFGYVSYIGSGAWLTNHQWGTYEMDGKKCKWTYFVKIVAAPADAYEAGGIWYTADDAEIGEVIWGSFAVIESVYNDRCEGLHGIEYLSPAGPGFGKW